MTVSISRLMRVERIVSKQMSLQLAEDKFLKDFRQSRKIGFFFFFRKKTDLLMGLNVHSNLLRLIRDGGKWGEVGGWIPMSYHLLATLSPPEWLYIKAGSCVRHFNISLIVWAKSQFDILCLFPINIPFWHSLPPPSKSCTSVCA